MRSNILIYLVGILFIVLTDTFLFIQIRKFLRKKRAILFYLIHSLLFILGLTLYHFTVPRLKGPESYYWIGLAIGILFLFYAPKVIFILLNILASIGGLLNRKIQKVGRKIATVCALSLFLILLYSMTWGRYNFKMTTREICFTNLPEAFHSFKIVQLTDLHLGSLPSHYPGISRLVKEVNALHPDLILFTGDMVNNFASELAPWTGELSKLNPLEFPGRTKTKWNRFFPEYGSCRIHNAKQYPSCHSFKRRYNLYRRSRKLGKSAFPAVWQTKRSHRRNSGSVYHSPLPRSFSLACTSTGRTHSPHSLGTYSRHANGN